MATVADPSATGGRTANLPGRHLDHIFFSGMALITLGTVFRGFARTLS